MDVECLIPGRLKVRNSVNPYIDREYFMERQKSRKYERGYRDKSFAM